MEIFEVTKSEREVHPTMHLTVEERERILSTEIDRLTTDRRIRKSFDSQLTPEDRAWIAKEDERVASGFYEKRDAEVSHEERYLLMRARAHCRYGNYSFTKLANDFPDCITEIVEANVVDLVVFPMPPQSESSYPLTRYGCFEQQYIPTTVNSPMELPKIEIGSVLSVKTSGLDVIECAIERARFSHGVFLRSPSGSKTLDTCQDRAGIVCDEYGEVRLFALADGVSSELLAGQTAQIAVDEALRFLGDDTLDVSLEERMLHFPENLQTMIRDVYLDRVRPVAVKQLEKRLFSNHEKRQKYTEALAENGKGATTCIAGAIDGNILRIACVADGGIMVFDRHGSVKMQVSEKAGQLSLQEKTLGYVSGKATSEKIPSPKDFWEYHETPLEEGDYVFALSNGIFEGCRSYGMTPMEELVEYFSRKIVVQQPLEKMIEFPLRKALGMDDTSILGFQYRHR